MITKAALVAAAASVLIAAVNGAILLRRIYTDERRRIADRGHVAN
jgi:hypothetical protein